MPASFRNKALISDAKRFIKERLRLDPLPAFPEIRLYTAHSGSGLSALADLSDDPAPPYWAYQWAGGLALASYFREHPEVVAKRSVLDLGAGGGIVSIAAARAGASHIIAAEVDPFGRAALALNAEANGVVLEILADNFLDATPLQVDVVVAGDLYYDAALAPKVTAFLEQCAALGQLVLIGDPGRAALPRARLRKLAEYEIADFGTVAGDLTGRSAVWTLV